MFLFSVFCFCFLFCLRRGVGVRTNGWGTSVIYYPHAVRIWTESQRAFCFFAHRGDFFFFLTFFGSEGGSFFVGYGELILGLLFIHPFIYSFLLEIGSGWAFESYSGPFLIGQSSPVCNPLADYGFNNLESRNAQSRERR